MSVQTFVEKHKTAIPIIFWGGLILIVLGLMTWRDTEPVLYNSDGYSEARDSYSCLMYELDRAELTEIALKAGHDVSGLSEKSIAELLNLPQCKDICRQQLKYASEYPDEWFADSDLRKICNTVGIELPE